MMWVFCIKKSVQGIKDDEGLRRDKVDFANESEISFPEIPEWLGAHKN